MTVRVGEGKGGGGGEGREGVVLDAIEHNKWLSGFGSSRHPLASMCSMNGKIDSGRLHDHTSSSSSSSLLFVPSEAD